MPPAVRHIFVIVLVAIILHLPLLAGWINPIPPNFTWWAPWNADATAPPTRGEFFDYLREYFPWQKYLHDSISGGELPLWNRYQFCGTPFFAERLLCPFYPPIAIGLLAPYHLSAYLISLMSFLIGSIFMYLYLRRIRLDGRAALLGAVIFCSSGLFSPFYPPWTASIVWVPAVLFIVEGWIQGSRGWRDVPWLSLLIAFWFIEGYAVFVVHGVYFILPYAILLAPPGRRLSTTAKLIIALIIGAAISAVQNLPTFFFALESARFVPQPDELFPPLLNILNISANEASNLMPSLKGAFKTGYLYLGLLPLLIMPFAALKPDSRTKHLFAWFGVCVLLGLIPPMFLFFYRIFPFWDITPHPPVTPLFLSAAALAAIGFHRLITLSDVENQKVILAFCTAVLLFVLAVILHIYAGLNKAVIFYALCSAALLCFIFIASMKDQTATWRNRACAGAIIAAIVLAATPWLINLHRNRHLDEVFAPPVCRELSARYKSSTLRMHRLGWQMNLPSNLGILWDIEDVGGEGALVLKTFYDAAERNGIELYRGREVLALDSQYPPDQGMLDEFGIGILLASPGAPGPVGHGWTPITGPGGSSRLFVNPNAWRAGLIPEGKYMVDAIPLEYNVDGPNAVKINVGGDKVKGKVVVKDTFAHGWNARVDGEPVEIKPYRGWMRRVDVPEGAGEIVMKYEPVEFTIGAIISVIGLFISFAWLAGGYRRRRSALPHDE